MKLVVAPSISRKDVSALRAQLDYERAEFWQFSRASKKSARKAAKARRAVNRRAKASDNGSY